MSNSRPFAFVFYAICLAVSIGVTFWLASRPSTSANDTNLAGRELNCAHWSTLRCCQLFGVQVTPKTLLQKLPPDTKKGHSLLQVAQLLQQMGLKTEGRRETFTTLSQDKLPCIAHLKKPDHYIVVSHIDAEKGFLHVYDGDGQRTRYSRKDFEKRWSGIVLLVKHSDESTSTSVENMPKIQFDYLLLDKGDIPALGKPIEFAFPFRNCGGSELIIEDVRVQCSCLKYEKPTQPIPANENGVIKLFYYVIPDRGVFSHTALVKTNDPRAPHVVLALNGFSGVDVHIVPNQLVLDPLIAGRTYSARCFVKYSGEWEGLEVQLDDSKLAGAKIVEHSIRKIDETLAQKLSVDGCQRAQTFSQTRLLELLIQPSGDLRDMVEGTLVIRTNVAGYEEFMVPVAGTIQPPVRAYPSIAILDKIHPLCTITLLSLTGEPFQVLSVNTHSENITCRFDNRSIQDTTELEFRAEHPEESTETKALIYVKMKSGESSEQIELPLKISVW